MKKTLILLAGYPATGKTYLRNKIEELVNLAVLSPDDIKEIVWKSKGFKNLEEKEKLVQESWVIYYGQIEKLMISNDIVLSEYPFSIKQKSKIIELCDKHGFQVLTIRLIAEFEELYKRHKKRDLDLGRDIVYVVSEYNPDNPPVSYEGIEDIVDKKEFKNRYENRGYGTFELGKTIEIDTTCFEKVNYDSLLKEIKNYIEIPEN